MKKKLITGLITGVLMLGIACCAVSVYSTSANAAPINVANLYGTATANSYYKDFTPDLVIDNDRSTGWLSGGYASTNDPDWLTIDLQESYPVNSIDLFWFEPNGKYANYTVEYSVYYRLDNTDWTFVGSGTFIDETSQITNHFEFDPPGQDMRYVKYEVTGGTHWSSIAEIKVWADDGSSSSLVPEPATMLLVGFGLLGLVGMIKRKR